MIQERHDCYVPGAGTLSKPNLYPTGILAETAPSRHADVMLPNNLASYRKAAGLTQEGLAEAIGTSRSMVVKLERGERPLNADWLEKLGEAMDVAPYLLIAPPEATPSVEQLAQLIAAAQQSLPAGLPYSEWPRVVASELHMRLHTLAGDRANSDSSAN